MKPIFKKDEVIVPTDEEIEQSLIRVNQLKPIDIISLVMQVRAGLDGAERFTTDPGRLRWLKSELLSNCTLMAKMDREHPQKSDPVQMLALLLLTIAEMPLGNSIGTSTLN